MAAKRDSSATDFTAAYIRRALDETGGNKSLAARKLGVSRRALYRLIEKYEEAPAAPGS